MTEIQDWHFPPPSPASLWSRRAHAARGRRSGGTARTATTNATAPTGKYGEGQGHQHTEIAGQDRSGNAGNGSPQTLQSLFFGGEGCGNPLLLLPGRCLHPVCWRS